MHPIDLSLLHKNLIHDDIWLDSIYFITSILGETHGWMHLFVPCSRGSQWWVSEEEVISRWNHLWVFNVALSNRALKSTKIQVFSILEYHGYKRHGVLAVLLKLSPLYWDFLFFRKMFMSKISVLIKAYETAKNDLSVFINGICILKRKLCLHSKYGSWQKILLSKR